MLNLNPPIKWQCLLNVQYFECVILTLLGAAQ